MIATIIVACAAALIIGAAAVGALSYLKSGGCAKCSGCCKNCRKARRKSRQTARRLDVKKR